MSPTQALLTRTVSQNTKENPCPAQIVISLELSPLIFFEPGLSSFMYNLSAKFHLYRFICLGGNGLKRNMDRWTDIWMDRVIPIYLQNFVCRGIELKSNVILLSTICIKSVCSPTFMFSFVV